MVNKKINNGVGSKMKQELIKKISKKYKNFHEQTIKNGGKFIVHTPYPKIISK